MKSLLTALFFFLATTIVPAQRAVRFLVRISAEGEELRNWEKKFPAKTYRDSLIAFRNAQRIRTEMIAGGYITCDIGQSRVDSTVEIAILPGQRYTWKALRTGSVDPFWLDNVNYRRKGFSDQIFGFGEISALLNGLLNFGENNGYPFVSVQIDSVIFSSSQVEAALVVVKGPEVKIDSLIIKGGAKISNAFLRNYLGIHNGDLYDEHRILRAWSRMGDLPFLEISGKPVVEFSPGKADLYFAMKNRRASRFDGILGIVPDPANDGKLKIGGEFNLLLHNAFGRGEKVSFKWKKRDGASQDLDAGFNYPCLLSSAFGLDFRLKLLKQDTLYLNMERKLGVQYLFGGENFIEGYTTLRQSDLISVAALKYATELPDYADVSTQAFGIRINYEQLDYRFNPSKGFAFQLQADAGTRRIRKNPALNEHLYDSLDMRTSQYNIYAEGAVYLPLRERLILRPFVSGGYIPGENVFVNEMFTLGGFRRLRGHDEDAYRASAFMLASLELRLKLEKNSSLFVFGDFAAWEARVSGKDRQHDTPWGVGAGLNFESRLGIFSLVYGLGSSFGNGLDLRSGKVHVGFLNYF
ncbi:MAG: BamA/TamA family outer membrane protein [Bacteroidetes bacterium]|nr:BamA/TamA family outer membrane protein [Bacteroidota bacterium]MBU1721029.1 BamA/TamA family outer membrane protein [Bacteroidota bacterium]